MRKEMYLRGFLSKLGADASLLDSIKKLLPQPPEVHTNFVNNLKHVSSPLTTPSLAQILNPFISEHALVSHPNTWKDTTALDSLKKMLDKTTNPGEAITNVFNTLSHPVKIQDRWLNHVLTSPVNAGFSNEVRNVVDSTLPKAVAGIN